MMLQYKLIAYAIALAAIVAAVLGYGHYQYRKGVTITTATYEAALTRQKLEAATTLATETAKVAAVTQRLNDTLHNQEIQDATNQATVAKYQADLRRMADSSGRLRDPNAGRGCGCDSAQGDIATSASAGAADRAEAGGLLSKELSGLLLKLTADADEVNIAYASCRADALNVRELLRP